MLRIDGRDNKDLRDLTITRDINKYAEGSCRIQMGDTIVYCTATVEDRVPRWLVDSQQGWVTADYGMLPRSTKERSRRESKLGYRSGRTQEIERLIGRSLRAVVNLNALGERTIQLDCDVLQADGGTRTAAITAAYVALAQACSHLREKNQIRSWPLRDQVAAVSIGVVSGELLLDLCYEEDSRAAVDMNLVMTAAGNVVELQATAEGTPFTVEQMNEMIALGREGLGKVFSQQQEALADLTA
ncbi:MAG: ribonuclease PH [Armatimonadetes bacterium]|nr:ribonuclease PH [Armatimonadota bacterium]